VPKESEMHMPKISAVINTRNEELNIKFCLESLKWCDEIIVVDMESDDYTVAIAREYTKKIFTHEKVLDFDIARVFAVAQATGDWVLLIDADELVTHSLAKRLISIAQENVADIVSIPFKTYMLGAWITHTGWWPEYHSRFFRRGSLKFTGDVHAFISELPGAKKLQLPALEENAIIHFAYHDCEHFVTKLNRYTTIEAMQMHAAGRQFSVFRMIVAGLRGFQVRYITNKGFMDGYRGFFLSLMMGFYRTLTYMKLWENFEFQNNPVSKTYQDLKEDIISQHRGE
jgi:glycosyltransferase involved in cell wall biosynthesis